MAERDGCEHGVYAWNIMCTAYLQAALQVIKLVHLQNRVPYV